MREQIDGVSPHHQPLSQRARSVLWIFDLDNTLHNASAHVFPHINRSMTAYLQQHLQLEEPAANDLRMHYWRRYGATLSGMMRHHDTDPDHFLWHTHQFPDLENMVLREPRLRHVLRRLPGKKVLFSNAPQHYVTAVLKLLRIPSFLAVRRFSKLSSTITHRAALTLCFFIRLKKPDACGLGR